MTSRARLTLALAAVLATGLAVAGSASAQAPGFFGVAPQSGVGTLEEEDFTLMEEAGVGSLRFLANRPSLTLADGTVNTGVLDHAIGNAAARGIKSLPVLFERPAPTTTAQRRALAGFAGELAARYGPGGDYWDGDFELQHPGATALPVLSWQVLNEQNGRAYYGRKPSPKAYAKTLRMTARAIKSVHPGAEIVLGGMFGTPSRKGSMTSWKFLDRLYRVKRIKREFGTVAIHPYGRNLKQIRLQVERIRKVMRRNRDRKSRVRVTELGWGSRAGGHSLNKGLQGQARMLRKAFGMLAGNRGRWRISGVHWFSWQDGEVGCPFCPTAGLLRDDRSTKPSFNAFRSLAH